MFNSLPRTIPRPYLLTRHHLTTAPPPPQDTALANLILTSTNHRTLAQALHSPSIQWTQALVNSILKRLWNHGPKALQFFKVLDHHPSYCHHPSSYDHAIDISARLRDFRSAWALLVRMRSRRLGPSPRTFAVLAERTLRGRFKADCVSYNIIANGWCLIKRTPKALEVLKEMVQRGLSPNLTTYNIMLKGYLRAGQTKEAWDFLLEMKRRKCEIDVVTYTTMVHGFGVVGEIKKARKIFDEMTMEGVLPSVATFNALIQVLCKKDSVENALLVFEDMVKKGYVPNTITYNLLIRGLCHTGEMQRAMEFMGRMKEDECEPNVQTYNLVIRYSCDAGDIERGLDVFEKMDSGNCLPNLDTFNILIGAMFVRKKSDDLLMAGKLLIKMVDRGFLPRKFTFNQVLNGLLLTGNQGFAKEILRLQSRWGHLPRQFKL
ncbi:putative pentatricopeptide repeat-containing protein [Tripterygium wilfordii]|uniref:Putative pentatricopeptide repeat-containing protein n=1 Tax=Tripterygium wilfordii TaxID=458696 RepID=A0A7J7CJD5_TRIWF|nr:pentatricopeptide repeat-containing protein At1g74900, mitochondrial isoform X2 [Tripterygium wilfordii]KAF5734167.1 putative pentatricopeptide repeat-containing protein [Tripterygium wilfordii]